MRDAIQWAAPSQTKRMTREGELPLKASDPASKKIAKRQAFLPMGTRGFYTGLSENSANVYIAATEGLAEWLRETIYGRLV
jgi:hypothetical protein